VQELGSSIRRQLAKLANGNIPYHKHHAAFRNGGWQGGRRLLAFLVFWELELLQEGFREFCEICEDLGVL